MTFLIIAAVILGVLVVVLGLVGLVRTRTGPTGDPRPSATTGTAVLEPDVLEPDAVATGEPAAPTLEVERPTPVAGRLRLLRDRLSRSQSTLGRGLLALLSRDRLDEQTWEEIEEILLTADVGVAPTQELVDQLRTRMRVEG